MSEAPRTKHKSSASGLSAHLKKTAPSVQTYQALMVLGMQEDFLSQEGALPVLPPTDFVQRIIDLVPKFRDRAGDIIWVRSDTAAETAADTLIGAGKTVKKFFANLDHQLDKIHGPDMPNVKYDTSDFTKEIKTVINSSLDCIIEKRQCSPFTSTRFQTTLHTKMIGDVYICGAMSELAIYAFARDAASRALRIHIIEDCLGFRNKSRSDYAVRRIVAHMNGTKITSKELHEELDRPLQAMTNTDDLADLMQGVLTTNTNDSIDSPVPKKITRTAMIKESELLMLPSGILKHKKSTAKIYAKRPQPEDHIDTSVIKTAEASGS